MLKGSQSSLKLVMSGDDYQRSVLGLVLFNSFASDLKEETKYALIEFVDYSNFLSATKMPMDRTAI